MASVFNGALAVKELEPGEWHWMILSERSAAVLGAPAAQDEEMDGLCYTPQTCSDPHSDAAAAWAAGYLVVRAAMRRAARG